ncbi:MAG: flap endonuclease [Chthoniobacterales bacterium]|nr:flap endonuclease [Chthoniobacterales bacterium]
MRLLLVDGHYYAYRSFFAIRNLSNSRGEPTNAVFGFVKALRKMIADVRPDAAAVVWDAGLPERRMQLLPSYKQQREETPPDLSVQFPVIERAVAALGFHNVRLEGHEADDLIASYAAAARRKGGGDVVIATNDKDIYALVGEGIAVYSTNKTDTGGAKDGVLLGPAEVEAKWGVPPGLIPDVLALTGDAVDNIPGVGGVGTKTAAKLVREHGRVALLAENPAVIRNEKLRAKVAAAAGRLRDNLELVRLEEDLPLPVVLEALSLRPDPAAMLALARECEFRSLTAEFEKLAGAADKPVQGEFF